MTDCVTNAYIAQMIGVSAQVIATLISAAGLIFVATQVRQATRSTDLRTLYEFVQQTEDLEARLNDVDESKHRRVVYELLNFLEVTAVACRRRLFGKASGEIAREKLMDSLAEIWATPEMHPIIEAGVTSGSAFIEIRKFIQENRSAIKRLVATKSPDGPPTAMD